MSEHTAEIDALDLEPLTDWLENVLVEYDEDAQLFGSSGAGAYFLAKHIARALAARVIPPEATAAPSFRKFKAKALRDERVRAAYEAARARQRLIDVLVAARLAQDIRQTDVARAMGVKQPSVSGFETEGSDPRLSTVLRYAWAIGARVEIRVIPPEVDPP